MSNKEEILKTLHKTDPNTLHYDNRLYLRALTSQDKFDDLVKLGSSSELISSLIKQLKFASVRKALFVEKTTDQIISILDQCCSSLRIIYMTILIEMYSKIPSISNVATEIFQHPTQHPWILISENLKFLFALLPEDQISKALNHISKKNFEVNYSSYFNFIHEKEKYSKRDPNFYIFDIKVGMPSLRIWQQRKSIFNIIGESFLSILEIAKSDETFEHEIIQQFSKRLIYFEKGFPKKDPLLTKIKSAIESIKFSEKNFHPFDFLFQTNPNSILPIKTFLENEWLNSKVFFNNHILPAFQKELSEGKLTSIKSIIKIILSDRDQLQTNMLHVFRSLSRIKPDHPLSNVWKKIIEILPEVLAEKYRDELPNVKSRRYYRNQSNKFIEELQVVFEINPSKQQFFFTFNESIQILSKSFEKLFDLKKSIVSSNPFHYNQIIKSIFDTFVGKNPIYSYETLLSYFQKSILAQFDPSLIDRLILEYVRHPVESGKPFNQELAASPDYVYLNYLLLISDFRLLAISLPSVEESKIDQFGFFKGNKNYVVPSLPSSKTRTAMKYEAQLHALEFHLFKKKLLNNPDLFVSQASIQIYSDFLAKLLITAYETQNQKLCIRAMEVYSRFTRFCLGVTRTENETILNQTVVTLFSDPLVYAVGFKTSANFVEEYFQPLLKQLSPVSTTLVSFSKSIILGLLNANWEYFPEAELSARKVAIFLHENYLTWINNSSSSKNVTDVSANLFPRFVSKQHQNEYYQKQSEFRTSYDLTEKYVDFQLNHINSFKKRSKPIEFEKNEEYQIPSFNIEFVSQTFSPSVTFYFLQSLSKFATEYQNKLPITDQCQYVLDLKTEVLNIIKSNLGQEYSCNEEQFKAKFSNSGFLDKYSVAFLYSITNSSSSFHRLFDENPNNLDSTINLIKILENFKPSLEPPKKEIEVSISFTLSSKQYNFAPIPTEIQKYRTLNLIQNFLSPSKDEYFKLSKSPNIFYFVILNLIKSIRSVEIPIENPNLLGDIISILIDDLALEDSSTSKTIFADLNVSIPVPKWRTEKITKSKFKRKSISSSRSKRKITSSKKQDCLSYYSANEYLLSELFDLLSLPTVKPSFNNFSFLESFLHLMSLPPDEQSRRLGLNRKYFFPQRVISGILSYIDFGEEEYSFDFVKTTTSSLFKVFYSIFGSDVFHHSLISLISDLLLQISSFNKRKAIITLLLSVFSIDDSNQRISISAKIQILALSLSPQIVGFPLPNFILSIIKQLSLSELLHIDVRKSIITSIISYFNFQSTLEVEKTQVNELFEIMESIYKTAKDATTPFFCYIYDKNVCSIISSENKAIAQLLLPSTLPSMYTPFHYKHSTEIQIPKTWNDEKDRFLLSFIAPSLSSNNQSVQQLVIGLLTKVCQKFSSISEKVVPFLSKGLQEFQPSFGIRPIIAFACNFCFVSDHQGFTDVITSFIDLLKRYRNYLDDVAQQHFPDIWFSSSSRGHNYQSPLKGFLQTIIDNIKQIYARAIKDGESFETINKLSERILNEIISVGKNPLLNLSEYQKLISNLTFASDKSLSEIVQNHSNDQSIQQFFKYLLTIQQNKISFDEIIELVYNKISYHFKLETIDIIASFKDVGKSNQIFVNYLKKSLQSVFDFHQYNQEQKQEHLISLRWILEQTNFSTNDS